MPVLMTLFLSIHSSIVVSIHLKYEFSNQSTPVSAHRWLVFEGEQERNKIQVHRFAVGYFTGCDPLTETFNYIDHNYSNVMDVTSPPQRNTLKRNGKNIIIRYIPSSSQ